MTNTSTFSSALRWAQVRAGFRKAGWGVWAWAWGAAGQATRKQPRGIRGRSAHMVAWAARSASGLIGSTRQVVDRV